MNVCVVLYSCIRFTKDWLDYRLDRKTKKRIINDYFDDDDEGEFILFVSELCVVFSVFVILQLDHLHVNVYNYRKIAADRYFAPH